MAARKHALLALDMRLGKTMVTILAAQKIGADRILVVCPAIAVEHWSREFVKWWTGAIAPRHVVISFDRLLRNWSEIQKQTWDLVVIDECHFAKNPEAQRTKLIYGKGGLGWVSDRLWVLSGTPAPKHAGELYCMLKAFGAVGLSYWEFTRRYCTFDWTGKIKGTNPYRIEELKRLLAPIMLRRKRADVAPEMPAIDFQFLEVEPVSQVDLPISPTLSDSQVEQYLQHGAGVDKEDRIEVAKAKALPLVENIAFALENDLLKQTAVFGWHIEPLEAVVAALRHRGFSAAILNGSTSASRRVEIQDDFRHGKIQIVVANILAAGTAIDLSAASHGYFLELDWVGANNLQAANRLVSMDKHEPVTFDVATWVGSADDRVQRVLVRRMAELKELGLA